MAGWRELAYVTVPQAAVILACGKTKAWDKVYAGELPSVKDGMHRRIPVAGLIAYIERKNREAGVYAA